MRFEFDNNIPIYVQLVEQIKIYILSGIIEPGHRLPSVRDLALQIRVNPNTIVKALSELEEQKLIYTQRTNGKYITKDQNLINKIKKEYANELSSKYLLSMKKIGYDKKTAIGYLKDLGGNQ